MRAEICHVNQMVWHLNTLPGGMPSLKDIELDNGLAPTLPVGLKKDVHAQGALSSAHGTSIKVNYTTCCGRQYYRWTHCPHP